MRRPVCRILIALAMVLTLAPAAMAAPKAELWPRWQAHVPGATAAIDHGAWDRFLSAYVVPGADSVNRVRYGKVGASHRRALDTYIAALAATPIDQYDRPEQRAFWINLYNALTVKLVLDRYPIASIRDIDISPGLFDDGPWGKKLVMIVGERLSLDDIEHRILRPIWRDPRLHYALNCAALGCPNLQPRAFTAANGEAMLDAAARDFVNHPRGARVEGNRLIVSRIYDWFVDDFGGDATGVLTHLRRYASTELLQRLTRHDDIDDHDYDWLLNDMP
ncbi:MAG: DUF547 domain-containing protein [Dongiaceae bacterium]